MCIRIASIWYLTLLLVSSTPVIADGSEEQDSRPSVAVPVLPEIDEEAHAAFEQSVNIILDEETLGTFRGVVVVRLDVNRFVVVTRGLADAEMLLPIEWGDLFDVGELSELFTAVCVLKLVDNGKLSLDTTLADVFEFASGVVGEITVRDLLTHRTSLPGQPVARDRSELDRDLVLRATFDAAVGPAPDRPRYAATNFVVLAAVIEEVTELDFSEAIRRAVPGPNFSTLGELREEEGVARRVRGRVVGALADGPDTWRTRGAAGLAASAWDVMSILRELDENTLLSPESRAALLEPIVGNRTAGFWYSEIAIDTRLLWQTGSAPGFTSWVEYFPDIDASIVILADEDAPVRAIAERFRDLVLDQPRIRSSFRIRGSREDLEALQQAEWSDQLFSWDSRVNDDGEIFVLFRSEAFESVAVRLELNAAGAAFIARALLGNIRFVTERDRANFPAPERAHVTIHLPEDPEQAAGEMRVAVRDDIAVVTATSRESWGGEATITLSERRGGETEAMILLTDEDAEAMARKLARLARRVGRDSQNE